EVSGTSRNLSEDELAAAWPEAYVAEGVTYAKLLGATYTALYPDEYAAFGTAAKEISHALGVVDSRVLSSLPHMQLPYFDRLDASTLAAVRDEEQSFEDFRKVLRDVAKMLPGGIEDPQFEREVRTIEEDLLIPMLRKLYETVSGTQALRSQL